MSNPLDAILETFEPVIGLEVHVQLATNSKLFCGCKARLNPEESVAEVGVNAFTCPVCTGHPGTLPVLNKRVVEFAIRAGLALGCKVNAHSVFSRKNYFYPDLPKGYQISQFDLPICTDGFLNIDSSHGKKRVTIQRIHIEEDAGKNVHMSGYSLVNLNRSCVPLIEIVSGPDLRSSEEAGAYLRELYSVITYLGVCDGNLQEGNFRCDANVSIRPRGAEKFGTRTEIKNVNSFRFIEKAIDYEIQRQAEVLGSGEKVIQETRGYDSDSGKTFSMRTKEEAHDYRYFPEPDLLPLEISSSWISTVQKEMPELPSQKRERYQEKLGLSEYDAQVLTASKELILFFEETLAKFEKDQLSSAVAKPVANLLAGEVSRILNEENESLGKAQFKPQHLADLVKAIQSNTISVTAAKSVLAEIWKSGGSVDQTVDRLGLRQLNDTKEIESIIAKIIEANPGQVQEYRSGKEKLFGFFVGQTMKASGGKANPGVIQDLLKKMLKGE